MTKEEKDNARWFEWYHLEETQEFITILLNKKVELIEKLLEPEVPSPKTAGMAAQIDDIVKTMQDLKGDS